MSALLSSSGELMNIYGRRGALVFLLFSAVFSGCMFFNEHKIAILASACIFAAGYGLFVILKSKKLPAVIAAVLCASAVLAGYVFSGIYRADISRAETLSGGKTHTVTAIVTDEIYEKQFSSAYYLKASNIDGEKSDTGIFLEISYLGDFDVGAEISFETEFSLPTEDEAHYLKSSGIFICAESDDVFIVSSDGRLTLPQKINKYFDGIFREKMSVDTADFASAVFLGNRGDVAAALGLAFRRAGTSHLLALSGLHLSIIVLGLDFLLRMLKIRKQIRLSILLLATAAFAVVTGLSASVFRSAVMLALYFIAQLFGEEKDSLTALFAALAVILAVRPYAVWDAGLWMSFSATLGLVLFSDVLAPKFAPMTRENYSKFKKSLINTVKYISGLIAANVIAIIFTLPVTYLVFGGISLVSPLSNLILVPLVQILLYVLFIFCAAFYIPFLSSAVAFFAEKITGLIQASVKWISSPEKVYISMKYPFTPYIIAVLLLCVAVLVFVPKIKRKYIFALAFLACVSFAVCLGIYSEMTKNEIYTVCVSEKSNDAFSFIYRGKKITIDVSAGGYSAPYNAATSADGLGADEVDMLVLTHLHKNHIKTVEKLASHMKIDSLLLPTAETDNDAEILSELIRISSEYEIKTEFYNRKSESSVEIGEVKITLPEYIILKRSTHPVITFTVSLRGRRILTYAGASAEEGFGEEIFKDSCAVIVGAHGPVYKIMPDSAICSGAEYVIFSNDEVYSLAGCPAGCEIVSRNGGILKILIK